MRIGRSFILLAAAVLLVGGCTAAEAEDDPRRPPRSIAELSTAEIQSRWWSWAASSRPATNPMSDPDGRFCADNQPADAWYLAMPLGGKAERRCAIPQGRPVVFPVINFTGTKDECAAKLAGAEGKVMLDSTHVEGVERMEPTAIRIKGVEGNPVTQKAGTVETYGCGLWVRLGPVPGGTGTLTVDGTAGSLSLSVTYKLEVDKGKV
ncbi:signal protein [Streptomyces sp. MS1.HAVA.3]|uniref:Signal protein n=1 Tax=Streptomyces caledonius TaxID=3134107 RepID=A0ABU8UAZ0_9ACTN